MGRDNTHPLPTQGAGSAQGVHTHIPQWIAVSIKQQTQRVTYSQLGKQLVAQKLTILDTNLDMELLGRQSFNPLGSLNPV